MAKLTLINGKLRVEWSGSESGSIVEADWLSPSNEYEGCCCCSCSLENNCSISESGLLQPSSYGWFAGGEKLTDTLGLPEELPIEAEFRYEDSSSPGCGGSNGNQQIGNISCCFCLDEETEIEIKVSGKMEQQDAGFDYGTLSVDNLTATYTQVQISSYDRNLQCQMIDDEDSTTVTLPAGKHTYIFSADTRDGQWHTGMTHKFSIKKAGA